MTPTIDQIEAALPYVPAGLHCGDLTEPDERREFAEVIHGIVVAATRCESETAPESRQAAATDPSAPAPQNDPPTPHRRNNGVTKVRGLHSGEQSITFEIDLDVDPNTAAEQVRRILARNAR